MCVLNPWIMVINENVGCFWHPYKPQSSSKAIQEITVNPVFKGAPFLMVKSPVFIVQSACLIVEVFMDLRHLPISSSVQSSKIPRAQSAKPLTYWFSLFMSCFTLVHDLLAWRKTYRKVACLFIFFLFCYHKIWRSPEKKFPFIHHFLGLVIVNSQWDLN